MNAGDGVIALLYSRFLRYGLFAGQRPGLQFNRRFFRFGSLRVGRPVGLLYICNGFLPREFRTGGVLINVLIAVAVSLIVNFSYFVFMILHRTARMPSEHPVSENSTLFMVLEVLFYMAVSFILLTVFTHNLSESKIRSRSFPKRLLAALVISVVVYFLAPYMNRAGDVKIILAARRLFNPMVLLKCSFMSCSSG